MHIRTLVTCARSTRLCPSHFLGYVQYQLAISFFCPGQQTTKLAQIARVFSCATPGDVIRRLPLWEDLAARVAPRRRRKARTWARPAHEPFSLTFRWPGRYVRSQRGRRSSYGSSSSKLVVVPLLGRVVQSPLASLLQASHQHQFGVGGRHSLCRSDAAKLCGPQDQPRR